jgi:deoxyribonuclease-4
MGAADGLRFGTAGVPDSTPQITTLAALKHVHGLGLDGLEVEFVRGVKIGTDTARLVREKASGLGLSLSVHAPYYINLNSPETGKRLQSQEHILRSARMAAVMGARSVVFHAGYYGASTPLQTHAVIKKELKDVVSIIRSERLPVTLRIETMGKRSQYGSLDECLTLCQEVDGLGPCLDFSHIHARGEVRANTYLDFDRIFRKVGKRLGVAALKDIHIHISGIEYGAKGEIRHLNLSDSDFRYDDWVGALKDLDVAGFIICESPERETDAVMLKRLYTSYSQKR